MRPTTATFARLAATLLVLLFATPALAAVPTTLLLEGAMTNPTGGAVADGNYTLTFKLYGSKTAATPFWTEKDVQLAIKSGRFSHTLGSKTTISNTALNTPPQVWLGIQVGTNPEAPRERLHAVAFAMRAKVATTAEGLSCTGCVTSSAIKWNGDVNMGGNALSVGKLTSAGDVIAGGIIAGKQFVGDGSKLTGVKAGATKCASGLVMAGIDGNGDAICVKAQASVSGGNLAQVSNGAIDNQFVDVFKAKTPIPIPDNNPNGLSTTITVPDLGTVEKITVTLEFTNSEVGTIVVHMSDPAGGKYVLFDKSAKGGAYKAAFPPTKPVSGFLEAWSGKNPKGNWKLTVVDSTFKDNKFDGEIKDWSIALLTTSNSKIQVKGKLIAGGGVQIGASNATCDAESEGLLRKNKDNSLQLCENGSWVSLRRSHCPPPGVIVDGVCLADVFAGNRNFRDASLHCAGRHADLCTDSQSWVLRRSHMLDSTANWTNSFADNDSGQWSEANGGTGDNHSWTSGWQVPCCYNITPKRPTDKIVGGVRVVYVHNSQNVYWRQAARWCAGMGADLCSKSEYQILRDNKVVTAKVWASDHSDNDGGQCNIAIGATSDNPSINSHYGFACCATQRTDKSSCPVARIGGVCAVHIANSNSFNWMQVTSDCAKRNAQVCSMSQVMVLRHNKKVTANMWTASYSDNDSSQAAVAVGSVGDNHSHTSKYGYACCL